MYKYVKTSIYVPLVSLEWGVERPYKTPFSYNFYAIGDLREGSLWLGDSVWSWFSDLVYFVTRRNE